MLDSIYIYIGVMLICYFCCRKVEGNGTGINEPDISIFRYKSVWLTLVLLVLVKGLGYDMGYDYMTYCNIFDFAKQHGSMNSNYEFGFSFLNLFLAKLSFNLPIIFIVHSIIVFGSLFFFASRFRFSISYIIPIWIILFYVQSNNTWRQFDAMALCMVACSYLCRLETHGKDKKINIIKYCLWMLTASSFHETAIVFAMIFFAIWILSKREPPLYVLLGLLVFVRISAMQFSSVIESFNFLLSFRDNKYDVDSFLSLGADHDYSLSVMGNLYYGIFDAIIVIAGSYICSIYKKREIRYLYYLSCLFLIMHPVAQVAQLVGRVLWYPQFFLPMLVAIIIKVLSQRKKTVKETLMLLSVIGWVIFYFWEFEKSVYYIDNLMGHPYMIYPF